jgi:heme A synthase
MIAVVAAAYIAVVVSNIHRVPRLRRIVLGLIIAQLAAGILNFLLLAPIWMQLTHLFVADLLWISLVLFSASALEKAPAHVAHYEYGKNQTQTAVQREESAAFFRKI